MYTLEVSGTDWSGGFSMRTCKKKLPRFSPSSMRLVPVLRHARADALSFIAQVVLTAIGCAIGYGAFEEIQPAYCIFPLFAAVYVRLEFPFTGLGVGELAEPMPGLTFVSSGPETSSRLGADGSLLPGSAYVIIFWRRDMGCLKVLPRIQQLWDACKHAKKLQFFVVSRDKLEDLQQFVLVSTKVKVPIACDTDGAASRRCVRAPERTVRPWDHGLRETPWDGPFGRCLWGGAPCVGGTCNRPERALARHRSYLRKFGESIIPHVFVVGADGRITWHGHIARKRFIVELKVRRPARGANASAQWPTPCPRLPPWITPPRPCARSPFSSPWRLRPRSLARAGRRSARRPRAAARRVAAPRVRRRSSRRWTERGSEASCCGPCASAVRAC